MNGKIAGQPAFVIESKGIAEDYKAVMDKVSRIGSQVRLDEQVTKATLERQHKEAVNARFWYGVLWGFIIESGIGAIVLAAIVIF